MDSVGSNNEEELTSTITMGNILSSTNPEEEKEVDSVPTSSTDAFTNASIAQIGCYHQHWIKAFLRSNVCFSSR